MAIVIITTNIIFPRNLGHLTYILSLIFTFPQVVEKRAVLSS